MFGYVGYGSLLQGEEKVHGAPLSGMNSHVMSLFSIWRSVKYTID